ncbi:uncharacterized protein BXZ73DRAFT_77240 [Epithele typhae]|uniref:uncharacterized protein n=1 Tax=Epithele typhae TaxID=378194 RepID=UPI002007A279|nr:uncharacterized protein BXZ73DRAFT_77240 [Epithele typhae]KAH9933621.1 hypothetical protein BXZ73DRAFT_77240 [Epithele typhae]
MCPMIQRGASVCDAQVLLSALTLRGIEADWCAYKSAPDRGQNAGYTLSSSPHIHFQVTLSLVMNVSDPSVVSPVLAIPGALPSLGDTFGSLLIATFISLVLYGIGMHQTFRYFQEYRKDRRILQMFVGLLISPQNSVADTFHTLICCHVCYYYLVVDYFNPLDLQKGIWSIRTSIITIAQAYDFSIAPRAPVMGTTSVESFCVRNLVQLLLSVHQIDNVFVVGSKYRYFAIFADQNTPRSSSFCAPLLTGLLRQGFGAGRYTAATFDDFAKFAHGFNDQHHHPVHHQHWLSALQILNSRKGLANAHADAFTVPTIDLLKPIGQSTTSTHGEHMFFSGAIRVNAERSDTLVLRPDDRTSREEDSAGLDVYQLQNMKA